MQKKRHPTNGAGRKNATKPRRKRIKYQCGGLIPIAGVEGRKSKEISKNFSRGWWRLSNFFPYIMFNYF